MGCPLTAEASTIRLTKVDGCGRPVCANDSGYVFDCFSTLAMNVNTTDGTDIEYKAANGRQCGFKRGCPTFNGYDLELHFFSLAPEFIDIATGNPVYFGYDGKPIGYDDCSVQCNSGFALEIWTEVISDECAVGATGQWMYFLLPWVTNGLLGDIELGSEAVDLTLTGATRAGGKWGVGPYNVQAKDAANTAGTMLTPLGSTCHRRTFLTTIAPPAAVCDYVAVTGGVCLTPVP
ncbi:hypothetical protein [Streptomyces sp. NRRL S-350]|uniref:hypothetical protein n=1 Tax=Streptomyces sp. NRRL S-350 TaxID=1463902 RepID=UPI0004C0EC7A|nr:hypothetical protein [Streptomyces sp. NRRL S-350]